MSSIQSWGGVFAAEFKRIILRTRTLVALALFALIGIGLTIGATSAMRWVASQAEAGNQVLGQGFVGLGLAASFVSFATSLLCVSSTARDYRDGAAAATLVVVPNRTRLLSVRIVVWALTALAVILVTLLPLALMYLGTYAQPTMAFAEVACATLGSCVLTLVAFACATLFKRGSLAMLGFLGIDVLLSMVLSVAAGFAPGVFGTILSHVHNALPGQAMDAAINVKSLFDGNSGPWIFGMVALVVWALVSVAVSHFSFARYAGARD